MLWSRALQSQQGLSQSLAGAVVAGFPHHWPPPADGSAAKAFGSQRASVPVEKASRELTFREGREGETPSAACWHPGGAGG